MSLLVRLSQNRFFRYHSMTKTFLLFNYFFSLSMNLCDVEDRCPPPPPLHLNNCQAPLFLVCLLSLPPISTLLISWTWDTFCPLGFLGGGQVLPGLHSFLVNRPFVYRDCNIEMFNLCTRFIMAWAYLF